MSYILRLLTLLFWKGWMVRWSYNKPHYFEASQRPGSQELQHSYYCSNSKSYRRFCQLRPWITERIIMIFLGHTCPIWTMRLLCVPLQWSWLNSKQRRHWIIGTFIVTVLQSHMFSAKFTAVVFWKNDYNNRNFHHLEVNKCALTFSSEIRQIQCTRTEFWCVQCPRPAGPSALDKHQIQASAMDSSYFTSKSKCKFINLIHTQQKNKIICSRSWKL